jgi:hypothetical protein
MAAWIALWQKITCSVGGHSSAAGRGLKENRNPREAWDEADERLGSPSEKKKR